MCVTLSNERQHFWEDEIFSAKQSLWKSYEKTQ